ncbi:polypeptide N-acetylgalactosaminyltransferase 2-like [Lingula anatina]|uniref:Polypeptide N-acetylgalactosaminyltransferase n=1 Tax=Lingula anatina TaxID=7574 RepID=A0A2R2MNP0_LINAN|nr:polypeptide N-acetylgalactosaminyltransferase 2-like [Lingula anatina]|eukprot:XP_023931824.1 polypeptide N-acetylgalactosaminyltransferase 2-like [Lingula anatina]
MFKKRHFNEFQDGQELLKIPKVVVLRNTEREGLIRSRNKGAANATAEVLVFLDSHCEVNDQWLEPLLTRIKQSPYSVVSPVIDVISFQTFEYQASSDEVRGGFDWSLNFKWENLSSKEKQSRKDTTQHIKSPVVAGGIFAIRRDWFNKIGQYDPDLEVWGGENFETRISMFHIFVPELSFKAWLCGGQTEILPCSRVGHIFRKEHPFSFPQSSDATYLRNTRRVAEVWLDEYKRFFYEARPEAKNIDIGDISRRIELRKSLGCRSFKWFMEKVYPELEIPAHDGVAYGQILQGDMCIDYLDKQVVFKPCKENEPSQEWTMKEKGVIRNKENLCLMADIEDTNSYVLLAYCKDDINLVWERQDTQLVHQKSGLCLDSHKPEKGLVIGECELSDTQSWTFSFENR